MPISSDNEDPGRFPDAAPGSRTFPRFRRKTVPWRNHERNTAALQTCFYVVATIKEDAIFSTSTDNLGNVPPTSSKASIQDIIKEVKQEDTRILANPPSPFLNEKQKAGKRQGLQEKGGCLCDKARNAGKNVDAPAAMTTERIDQEIRNNGAKF